MEPSLLGRAVLCSTAPVHLGLLQVCTKSAGFIAVVVDLLISAWRLSCYFSFQFGLSGVQMQFWLPG